MVLKSRRKISRKKIQKRYSRPRTKAIKIDGAGLGSQIGAGVQGIVYEDISDKERVIKCFPSNTLINEKIMNLVSIKNIGPKYYGVFKTDDKICYIQEKLYPIDMDNLETGKYDKQLSKLITELILDGVFHNDIKYDNMLLTKDGKLRLIDFDLSTEISNYGYKMFDINVKNNSNVRLIDGSSKPIDFTPKQIQSILTMRPVIEKTLYEVEKEENLKKAREEAKERARLQAQERLEKMRMRLSSKK